MKNKIYLHIGTAKTGTTTLQHFCANHQGILKKHGLIYPHAGRSENVDGHHKLARTFLSKDNPSFEDSPKILANISRQLKVFEDTDCILSSEEFSLISYLSKNIIELKNFFSDYHIVPVVYFREQVSFFNSFHAEVLSDATLVAPVDTYALALAKQERYSYLNWIDLWIKSFNDEVKVGIFNRGHLLDGDIIHDFFNLIGHQKLIEDRKPLRSQNVSWDNIKVSVAEFILSNIYGDPAYSSVVKNTSTRAQFKRDFNHFMNNLETVNAEPYAGIDADLAKILRRRYHNKNADFLKKFDIDKDAFLTGVKPYKCTRVDFWQLGDPTKRNAIDFLNQLKATI